MKYSANRKSKAAQISTLVDYIRNPAKKNGNFKVEYAGSLNFFGSGHNSQKMEMIVLAFETVHSKMPVNHWLFSLPEGEQPTHRQVDELVADFLKGMGLEGHQAIYGLYNNTRNYHILVDDVISENVLKLQKDGYKPAVIIESSPGNFQCVLTFPKFGGIFDRQIANKLAVMLNKKYGDPKLSGAIHPHRAPDFENRKPKHRRAKGSFPQVILRWAVRQDCQKCAIEARKIEQELERQKAVKPKIHYHFEAQSAMLTPHKVYFAHYEDICAHIAIQDLSRMDAMIALRMRANDHSEAEEEAIRICDPAIREGSAKRRNWQWYAERTAAYAFGYTGDRDMEQFKLYLKNWNLIESNRPTGNSSLKFK